MEQIACSPAELGQLLDKIPGHLSGPEGRKRYTDLMRYLNGEISFYKEVPKWVKTDFCLECTPSSIEQLKELGRTKKVNIESWVSDILCEPALVNVKTSRTIPVTYVTIADLGLTQATSLLDVVCVIPKFSEYIKLLPIDAAINLRNQLTTQPAKEEMYVFSEPVHPKKDKRDHLFRIANYCNKRKKPNGNTISLVRIAKDRMLSLTDIIAVERVV